MDYTSYTSTCFKCGNAVMPIDKFCPYCGVSLSLPSTTTGRQIFMYTISFFLPPFGLAWVVKYFKSPEQKAHIIAWIIIALTALSIIISIWVFVGFVNSFQQQLNDVNVGF